MVKQINHLQSTPSKNKSKTSILLYRRLIFCTILFTHHPIYFLTSLQLWGVPHARIWQALWNYWSQWCWKVNSPPAYRYARRSYTCTHFHPLCGAGSTVYFPVILLPYLESTNVQIVSDDTSALSSVLKADMWRGCLLAEEVHLNESTRTLRN
jgi:hypothetical protein